VLALAVTTHLLPRLDSDAYGAGRLTKVRAQAVSRASCRRVAVALGAPSRMRAVAPEALGRNVESLLATESVLAEVCEAVIGACHSTHGYGLAAEAVVEAFATEIEVALDAPDDFKSALQELAARRGGGVGYAVVHRSGPPHDPRFAVEAHVGGTARGRGEGRSKKEAEQEAAREALTELREA